MVAVACEPVNVADDGAPGVVEFALVDDEEARGLVGEALEFEGVDDTALALVKPAPYAIGIGARDVGHQAVALARGLR